MALAAVIAGLPIKNYFCAKYSWLHYRNKKLESTLGQRIRDSLSGNKYERDAI
jgi:hypothetical protein